VSIYRDDEGRWHGYVSMGLKPGGRRDRRHVTGKTRADVTAKVRAMERRRDEGVAAASGRGPTLSEWLEHWLEQIAARRVRPRTLESYRATVRRHIVPSIGAQRLAKLQPEQVEAMYGQMLASGLSPSSVLRTHRILSRALKVAMQRGKITRNVGTLVDPPTPTRSESSPLTVDEARQVLYAARDVRNAARWTVALALGLRQSEALGLKWSDVDLERGTLTVRRGLHRVSGQGLVFEEPKSARSRRTLALPAELVDGLRRHRKAQEQERVIAGSEWEGHDFVFAQPNGRPLDRRSDWEHWRALLTAAGVRQVRLHDGRHTAATLLLTAGVHPRVVMELLGHSQMRTTTDVYSHVMPAVAREAADRMGAALWGPERNSRTDGHS
jgi:integrase